VSESALACCEDSVRPPQGMSAVRGISGPGIEALVGGNMTRCVLALLSGDDITP